jgi:hypothetical protein
MTFPEVFWFGIWPLLVAGAYVLADRYWLSRDD